MSKTLDVYRIEEPNKCSGFEKFSVDNFNYDEECLLFTLSYYENILLVQKLLELSHDKRLDYGNDELYLVDECNFLNALNKFEEIRDSLNYKDYVLEHLDDFFVTVAEFIKAEKHLFFNIG